MIKHVLFLIHIQKKQNAMKLKFTLFPVIKNTIKGIAFKNACIRINYNFSVFFICQHSCRIYVLQSLKRSTFPFLRSFTVRSPSVHRAFSVRSSCVLRSQFCVQRSPFARVHRSQSVQRSLTVRSPIVHKAFIVHSAFSLHCHSELWGWKINIMIFERNDYKEIGVCFILKTWVYLSNKTRKNSQNFVKFEPHVN